MDFETFFQSLASIIKASDNVYCIVYAALTCLLTQIVKKLFVNKVKVEVLHKFNLATILPFVFGAVFACLNTLWKRQPFSAQWIADFAIDTATIGALATVIFKFASSLSGKSLKSLLKDDLFGIFYCELLYFGNIRERLLRKEISLKDFVEQVKLVSANAQTIYHSDETEEIKKARLFRLLEGILDGESIAACVDVLNKALLLQFEK